MSQEPDIPDAGTDPNLAYSMGLSPESTTGGAVEDVAQQAPPDQRIEEEYGDNAPTTQIGPSMPGDEDTAGDKEEEVKQRLLDLETHVRRIDQDLKLPDPYFRLFVASITATSGTAAAWNEQCFVSGTYQRFHSPREGKLASASGTSSALPMSASDFVSVGQKVPMLEETDPATKKTAYHYFSSNSVAVQNLQPIFTGDSRLTAATDAIHQTSGNDSTEWYIGLITDFAGNTQKALVSNVFIRAVGFWSNSHLISPAEALGPFPGVPIGTSPDTGDGNGTIPIISISYTGEQFVGLTMDGGSDGDATTAPTYTYTVIDRWGKTIGTNIARTGRNSMSFGSYFPANVGIISVAANGDITWCNEVPHYTAYTVVTAVDFGGSTVTTITILSPT